MIRSCSQRFTSSVRSSSLRASAIIPQFTKVQSSTSTVNRRLLGISKQFSSVSTNMAPMLKDNNNNDVFKLENLFSVKGKVALVTGGGSGIGLMATQALAVNGAKVYIVGRTEDKLQTVQDTFGHDIPGQIVPITADINSKEEIRKLVDNIKSKESHLDILINNAGVALNSHETEAKNAEEFSDNLFNDKGETFEMWTDTYRTNVASVFFLTTAFLPLLAKATEHQHAWSGVVINITSISASISHSQHHYSYNVSKAGTRHLTSMLSTEIASNGIKVRVNGLAPGVFPSEMTAKESDSDQKSSLAKEKYESKTAARRPGKDEDMGSAILFIATNQYLTGQTVTVDGGYMVLAGAGTA